MNFRPKIEIRALIDQLETFRVDQDQKLELAQAIMLGAAMGLRQQYEKIGLIERRLRDLEKVNDNLSKQLYELKNR